MYRNICSKPYVRLYSGGDFYEHNIQHLFSDRQSSSSISGAFLSQPPAQDQTTDQTDLFSLAATLIAVFIGILTTGFLSRAQASSEPVHYKYFRSIMVYSGDTLSAISSRYIDDHYTSVQDYIDEVCEMNHLQDADDIHAGDYLIIPYYSTDFH